MGFFAWSAPSLFNSTFLLVFQNETELRPTGGFMSAVGLLEIKNGKPHLSVIDSYSVQAPEKELTAPTALEDIFSEDPKYSGWVFRDTNFNPDFSESAEDILRFFQYDSRFTRTQIDGIVAVNFSVFESLLQEFGPINGLSSESLFLTLQRSTKDIDLHSKEDLANRKNILGETAKELLKEIGYYGLPKALNITAEAAEKKEVQMWFSSLKLQKKAVKRGWTGDILPSPFAVNMANLGAKKSDRYILRDYFSHIFVKKSGSLQEDFTLSLVHSGSDSLLSGEGNHFIRILRPIGTTLAASSEKWSQKTIADEYEEFSTILFLRPGEQENLSLSFSLPEKWTAGEKTWNFLKQSGTDARLRVLFQGEGDMSFSSSFCEEKENTLLCDFALSQDISLPVSLLPDALPPLLENAFLDNENEIFMRLSEDVSPQLSVKDFSLVCTSGTVSASKIFRNENYLRDIRIVLATPLQATGEFCQMTLRNVADLSGNKTNISMTLPLRYE